ncbi:MAG: hypothetical protein AAGD00_08665 [Planctomycetota bacterium]
MTAPLAILIAGFGLAHTSLLKPAFASMPVLTRRLRLANGVIMLASLPLLVAGFSLLDPMVDTRAWISVWLLAMPMVLLSVSLASADAIHSLFRAFRARANMRRTLQRARAELLAELHAARDAARESH